MKVLFSAPTNKYAILIKNSSCNVNELFRYYLTPLENMGIGRDNITVIGLHHSGKKTPTAEMFECLDDVLTELNHKGIKQVLVADGDYFKKVSKHTQAEKFIGYMMDTKLKGWEHLKIGYAPNWQSIVYNPLNGSKLDIAIKAFGKSILGTYVDPGEGIIHSNAYPQKYEDIKAVLDKYINEPVLYADIETFSLRFQAAGIGTIAFAKDRHNGIAFCCDLKPMDVPSTRLKEWNDFVINKPVRELLKDFFIKFKGKLVFHRANFDVPCIIYALFMEEHLDDPEEYHKAMIEGVKVMCGFNLNTLEMRLEDSLIVTYLATNSTAGNELGLKKIAQAFAGNYAIEEINDIRAIPYNSLLEYNLIDALSCAYAYEKNMPILIQDNQLQVYKEIFNPSLWLIIQTQLSGMPINITVAKEVNRALEDESIGIFAEIRASKITDEINYILQYKQMQKANAKLKVKQHPIEKFSTYFFNPNSPDHLRELLYGYWALPITDFTDTKEAATGGKTLKKLLHKLSSQDRIDYLDLIIRLKQLSKIVTAFMPAILNSFKGPNGYTLHGFFNIGGTVSGRMSCVAPWTPITTQRGEIKITDIRSGDTVWTHKEQWKPVTHRIFKGVEDMYSLVLANGEVFTCTTDHRVLLLDQTWITVGELLNVNIKTVGNESNKYSEYFETLQMLNQDAIYDSCGNRIKNNIAQYIIYSEKTFNDSRVKNYKSSQVLPFKNRLKKSYEGFKWLCASQLQKGMRGWLWLLNESSEWKKIFCASLNNGRSLRTEKFTSIINSPPYRQQPVKQSNRQSRPMHKRRTQTYPLLAGRGLTGIEIKEINYFGSCPVYDITVEDDESYLSCGFYSHNSSEPNLQNLPAGSKFGKLIKTCFSAPTGWLFGGADFNSLEDYVSALTTRDTNKLKVYLDGYDGHCLRAFTYFKDQMPTIVDTVDSINSIASIHADLRTESKAPTFLLTYLGTFHGLMNNLGWPKEKAILIENKYHELYKESDEFIAKRLEQVCADGYATVAFGLRVRAPMLHKIINLKSTTVPNEAREDSRTVANAMGQSYGLLNNRAAIDFMVKVWKSNFLYDIKMSSLIHDAIYLTFRDRMDVIHFVNKELIASMAWQNLPELMHPTVKIGAQLDIFYPNWAKGYSIPVNASYEEIQEISDKANEK